MGSIPGLGRFSWRRAWQPTSVFWRILFMENPMDRGAWQARVHSVSKSWTWLKWLSTHAHHSQKDSGLYKIENCHIALYPPVCLYSQVRLLNQEEMHSWPIPSLSCVASLSALHRGWCKLGQSYSWVIGALGFPGGSDGKESACKAGDLGSIPGLGRSLGGRHGNPFHYSCLEQSHGQRSLAGYRTWGRRHNRTTKHSNREPSFFTQSFRPQTLAVPLTLTNHWS